MFIGHDFDFSIDQGWWSIIQSLCSNIQNHIDSVNSNKEKPPIVEQVVVTQIKQKFGYLRFYYNGGDDRIFGMVSMAESWANAVCEECGAPGTKKTTGYIKNLCHKHFEESEARKKESYLLQNYEENSS